MNEGARVGAVSHSAGDTVYVFGYGRYVGDRHENECDTRSISPRGEALRIAGFPDPLIQLDDGSFIFGSECVWGPEDAVKDVLEKFSVVKIVNMADVRRYHEQRGAA